MGENRENNCTCKVSESKGTTTGGIEANIGKARGETSQFNLTVPRVTTQIIETFPIGGSATPLTASLTNDGVKLADTTGNRGDDDKIIGKHVSTARPDAGGAVPHCIEASVTPLSVSTTDKGVNIATEDGNWGDDDTTDGLNVFTARPDAGGAAPTHMEVPGTPLAASNTDF